MEESGANTHSAGTGLKHPYILRLVELNGEEAAANLTVPGRAHKRCFDRSARRHSGRNAGLL
jgi:hypothetical protein